MSVTDFTSDELESLDENWNWPRHAFLQLGPLAMFALWNQWPIQHWAVQTAWTLLFGYILFCWTSLFHECAHQTLTRSKSLSIFLGRLIGTALFVPYTVYRESHIQHHARLNKPNDWELWPYSDPHTSLAFRRCFVWFDILLGAVSASVVYNRIFFHKNSPLKGELRRTVWRELAAIVVVWGTVLTIVTMTHSWPAFFRTWCIPHLFAGSCQTLRKLTEHLGMASYDPLLGTRTVIGQTWFTRMCSFFHWDIFIHGPHHRHPRAANHELLERMQTYVQARPDLRYPIYPSYRQAMWAMLPSLWYTPGSGMNAGAPPPGSEISDNPIANFSRDVSAEILAPADVVVQRSA